MPPTISPATIGLSSYTVGGSANAWFYLDIDLGLGEEADLELHCPAAAVVTLAEGTATPLTLSTTSAAPTNVTATRTVDSAGNASMGLSTITITITATSPFHTAWLLRTGGMPPAATAAFQVTAGDVQVSRVLADPVVTAPALAPLPEKTPITLTGSARYTTVPPGMGPAGTAAPPVLRARWTQTPSSTSAPPPPNLFSATVATAQLNANIAPTPAFRTPGVYADATIAYRLTAFYDDVTNLVPDPTEPSASADVTLAVHPRTNHMILLVDRSGSMLATMPGTGISRWEFARRAAHVWADLWIAMRSGVTTDDKAAIMIFEAFTCGWMGSPAKPIEILLPTTGTLGRVSDLDVAALDLGQPGGCTPIGDALITAIDKFVTVGGTTDDRYVILGMTDGRENTGAVVIEDDTPVPPGATGTFNSLRAAGPRAAVSSLLSIYTVGLGIGTGSVQDSALQDLTDSPSHRGLYRALQQPDQLMATFGEMLGHALEAENITPANPGGGIPVSANENRLMLVLGWKSATDRMKVFRSAAGGPEEQVAGPGAIATDGITEHARANHGIVSVDLTEHFGGSAPPSTWRVEYWQNGTTPTPIASGDLLAMVDLFVKADVRFDRVRYATGQRALLVCQITAGGEPVTGAQVQVEHARPGEGMGTFLARRGSDYKPDDAGGVDPLGPKGAMLDILLRRAGLKGLPVETPTGIFQDGTDELWDDGQHRDGTADDGIYANTYAGLAKEGTYEWRFRISGTTPDGHPFERVATRSLWVGVGVDPASSKVEIRRREGTGERERAAEIIVTPVDAHGELLGPFRASNVEMATTAGKFRKFNAPPSDGIIFPTADGGEILSRYNGQYSRIVAYRAGEKPTVTITVQGRKLPDVPV